MKKRILLLVVLAFSALAISIVLSQSSLMVANYSLTASKLTEPIRIVQLTDLHNSEFGEENERLAARVAEQEPDLILVTGDLLNENEERTGVAVTLIRRLAEIAPVYVSFGNHEVGHERRFGTDLRALYTQAGARVLNDDWVDLTLKDQKLRIGGIYGYCLPSEYRESRKSESAFLEEFQNTERTTLLLCHMPVCWIINGSLDFWDVDVVLSGHIHGGQVRLPWIGGLWAPDQGWFPGKSAGLYFSEDGERVMVLSRGLGNTEKVPRINNIPEVLVLDLLPRE